MFEKFFRGIRVGRFLRKPPPEGREGTERNGEDAAIAMNDISGTVADVHDMVRVKTVLKKQTIA